MSMNTNQTPSTWLPDADGRLVIQPVEAESVAVQAVGATMAAAGTSGYRVPIVAADPSAGWVAEGAEIPVSDAELDEATDKFRKLAGLTIVSRELANDSSPQAAEEVGKGIARDIAKQLDAGFFGDGDGTGVAPAGLGSLSGVNALDAGTTWGDLDVFTEAVYAAEGVGATLDSFVANPADALALAQLRDADGSNRTLLQVDPTQPTRRLIGGVPLLVSPHVDAGTIWGLPADRVVVAIREDVEITRDASAYFSSDRIAVRGIMRGTFLYPHEAAIQRIELGA